ncbi:MAG: hypothetical protein H0T84_11310 [Tatlockia sp.]|nr:hypothetical protein [Tatlockia sp.]
MKKKSLLSKVVCSALCLSPLLLTGCGSGGWVGQSSRYDNVDPYARAGAYHRGVKGPYSTTTNVPLSTSQTVKRTVHTRRVIDSSSAAVPVEAPTVRHSSRSVNKTYVPRTSTNKSTVTTRTTTTSSKSNINNDYSSHNNVVPSPSRPTTGMTAPTVGQ